MSAQNPTPGGWLLWTARSRTSALIAAVALSVVWVFLGVWTVVQVVEAAVADSEFDDLVMLAILIEPALTGWLVSWPFMAYQRWMLALVDASDEPAWTTRIGRADAELLRTVVGQSEDSSGETFGRGVYVFTLAASAIVFWAVRSHRLRPIFRLPVERIESVWRRDFQPVLTYVSLVGVDSTRFVGLAPSRGRLRRLIRDREDGFRAISRLVGPAKVRQTEVRG